MSDATRSNAAPSATTSTTDIAGRITERVRAGFLGHGQVLELMIAALGAQAHVLIEGPPGTAKTLLAWTLARGVGLAFKRVQLTADLMPSDIIGTSVWLPQQGQFEFRRGPLFTDVLLADEINRAPPKTQAALLEAMQERQVTVDGRTHELDSTFWVVATQNPLEHEGTYPLPEGELDRFGLKLTLDYPAADVEVAMLRQHRDQGEARARLDRLEPAVSRGELVAWQAQIRSIRVDDTIVDYIARLVRATRVQRELLWGAGPRAALALLTCGRSLAAVRGRTYVIPDDIRDLLVAAFAHRLRLGPEARVAGIRLNDVLQRLVQAVPVPTAH